MNEPENTTLLTKYADIRFTQMQCCTEAVHFLKNATGFKLVLHLAEIGLHQNDLLIKIATIKLNSTRIGIAETTVVSRENFGHNSTVYKARHFVT